MGKEKLNIELIPKKERGITLIALVITIVILIILATVSISIIFGEGGLVQRAQLAKEMTEQATLEEQEGLNTLSDNLANIMAENQMSKVPETTQEAKPNLNEDGPTFENTTTITDDLDNEVTIPGGFNIAEDSGTKVEEGIVIEDSNDNQFVWIPVGEYNVTEETEKITEPDTQDGKLINNLSRRTFTESSATEVNGDEAIELKFYGEGATQDKDGNPIETVAKNQIEGFKTSATTNKGFYIGRYEQGEGNVCKAGVDAYVNVTRDEAKTQAEAMYSGNKYITSELISSYAWDTALNYICQTNKEGYILSTVGDKAHGNIGTGNATKTGEYEADKYSNIHDMLGNCTEWTTECFRNSDQPCINRGGFCMRSNTFASTRYEGSPISISAEVNSFRQQVYIN